MTGANDNNAISQYGDPALFVRFFGWAMLAVLAAFLINNVLIIGFDVPGMSTLSSDQASALAYIPIAIYVAALVLAGAYVFRTPNQALRWDAMKVHKFNCYLIRAAFWTVLIVGLVDATIALMRVENILPIFFDDAVVKDLGRARFIGPYIHVPLIGLSMIIALFTRTLGFHWLALMIVAAELAIVISRFVFSYEQALMADLVRYWYAALFLFASAYTLFEEGHVRVDILYAGFGRTKKGFVNAVGSILLGTSTAWVILWIGFNSKQAIINSPIMNFEITQQGSTGLYVKYQMAGFLALFAITMLIQFISYFFEAIADYRDEPGHRDNIAAAH